jgi:hypothetical protein
MEWLLPFLTITLPVLSTFIIAIISFFNSRRLDREKEIRKFKIELYFKFLEVENERACKHSINKNALLDKEYHEITGKFCLYASEEVLLKIYSLHNLYQSSDQEANNIQNTNGEKKWDEQYSGLILAIRNDIGLPSKKLSPDIVKKVMEL